MSLILQVLTGTELLATAPRSPDQGRPGRGIPAQEGDSGEPVRPGVRPAPRTGYGQYAEMACKEEAERNHEGE